MERLGIGRRLDSQNSLDFTLYFFNKMCGNSGSDGKGEWSEMVRACVEEG